MATLPVSVKVLRTGKRIGLIRARLKGIYIVNFHLNALVKIW